MKTFLFLPVYLLRSELLVMTPHKIIHYQKVYKHVLLILVAHNLFWYRFYSSVSNPNYRYFTNYQQMHCLAIIELKLFSRITSFKKTYAKAQIRWKIKMFIGVVWINNKLTRNNKLKEIKRHFYATFYVHVFIF